MKLQISGQQLRLRIDEEELAELIEQGRLCRRSQLAEGYCLEQVVGLDDAPCAAALKVEGSRWSFRIPRPDLLAYLARLPCREGLEYDLPGDGNGTPLRLSLEVDVRDSVRKRGPRRAAAGDRA